MSPGAGLPLSHLLSPRGQRACLWPSARRETGGLHLFFSHCSLVGKETRAGVSRSQRSLHIPASSHLPGGLGSVSGPALAPWLCSWAVAALPLNLLSKAPHPLIAQKGVVVLLFLGFCPTLWHMVSQLPPPQGMEPVPWAVESQRLTFPWTDREVPCLLRKL